MTNFKKSMVLISLAFFLLLTGCSGGVELMSTGHSNSKEMVYSYHYFDGFKRVTFHMNKDTNVKLNYDMNPEEGRLVLEMYKKDGDVVYEKSFNQQERGEDFVTIKEEGTYYIKVIGEETKGSFTVRYEEVKN